MASTYSTSLRLELMATGDQSGTWGTTTNTNLGTLLEQSITGVLSVAQGDVANLTLTTVNGGTDQARNAVVNLTGALTAARNVVVQTANKLYLIKNSTTGGFSITAKTAAGTGVVIPPLSSQWVYSDGTNVVAGLIGNMPFNNLLQGYTTTATAAGTTVLDVTSTHTQYFTGATTQTITLPVVSTLILGQEFEIINLSSGSLTVNSSGANLVATVLAGGTLRVQVILITGTSAASWNAIVSSVPNPLTLSGSSVAYTPLVLTSTEAAAAAGPIEDIFRDSASPAANDILGQLLFNGRDSAANKQEYGSIQSVIISPTSTTEASTLDFYTQQAGSRVLGLSVAGSAAISNNHVAGYTTTATAAGTTTLTVASTQQQFFTGSSTQTVVLPVTSTLTLGWSYEVHNNSTGGNVTVQSSGANSIQVMAQGSRAVFKVILTSGTTAASWEVTYYPAVAGMALLTSGTVSAAATLDIVLRGYTGYRGIRFILNLVPATDTVALNMRVSTNGGSSYDATGYTWSQNESYGGPGGPLSSARGSTSPGVDTSIGLLGALIGNGAAEGGNLIVELLNQTSTAQYPRVTYYGTYTNQSSTGAVRSVAGGGQCNAAQDTDAVRFLFSSGNIASGSYAVYGYL